MSSSNLAEKQPGRHHSVVHRHRAGITVIDLVEKIRGIGFPDSLIASRSALLNQRREARTQYKLIRKEYQPLLATLLSRIQENEELSSQEICDLKKEIGLSIFNRTRSNDANAELLKAGDSFNEEMQSFLSSNTAAREAFRSMYEAHILATCDRRAKRIREGKVDGGHALLLASREEYLTRLLDRLIRNS